MEEEEVEEKEKRSHCIVVICGYQILIVDNIGFWRSFLWDTQYFLKIHVVLLLL